MKIDRIGFIQFLKGECAIHCDTEKKAIKLVKILRKLNVVWCDDDELDFTEWEVFGKETTYRIDEDGLILTCKSNITLPIIKL